ncbi:MAG: PEP-CTERM sorting domain-containing protein [Pseudomonadota bacterium]
MARPSAILLTLAALLGPTAAVANIIKFDVSSREDFIAADGQRCSSLVLVAVVGFDCNDQFFPDGDVIFSVDREAGTGSFAGSLINRRGFTAEIDLEFSGFLDTVLGTDILVDPTGPFFYDPVNDVPAIDFFTEVNGGIRIATARPLTINRFLDPEASGVLQFGVNANDAFPGLGIFGRLTTLDNPQPRFEDPVIISGRLTPRNSTSVPAPAGMGLMALGLTTLGLMGWRRRKAAARQR